MNDRRLRLPLCGIDACNGRSALEAFPPGPHCHCPAWRSGFLGERKLLARSVLANANVELIWTISVYPTTNRQTARAQWPVR